jgi:SAM-dependent methyltransferase
MDFDAIDWNSMWQEESNRLNKNESLLKDIWDRRADKFSKRINRIVDGRDKLDKNDYVSKLLSRITVRPGWSVLDIGSGPGTLAIPLANKVKNVTALDVSSEMLKHLNINAINKGLDNILYINSSWQDAFKSNLIAEHDIVIASRSLMSGNMKEAIFNINSIARRAVYLTLPIVHLPFDWEVYAALGRKSNKHVPYVYFYNLLYQMGIMANIEILRSKFIVEFPNVEAAIEDLQWRTETFSSDELVKIRELLGKKIVYQNGTSIISHKGYSKWALIWWRNKDQI